MFLVSLYFARAVEEREKWLRKIRHSGLASIFVAAASARIRAPNENSLALQHTEQHIQKFALELEMSDFQCVAVTLLLLQKRF